MEDKLGYIHLKKNYKIYFIFILVSVALTVILNVVSRYFTPFAEWYSTTIYPIIVNIFGRIASIFPFSIVELLIYLGIIYLIYKLVMGIKQLFSRPKETKDYKLGILRLLSFIVALLLIFTLTTGINYHRNTFSQNSGLIIRESTLEELYELSDDLIQRAIPISNQVKADEYGITVIDVDLAKTAKQAMKNIGEKYEALAGYYPNPKPILASRLMSYTGIVGVYSSFTLEANYDKDVPAYDIPAIVLHELSHLKGFMREDEANFIAYLACLESDSLVFQYSGIVSAIMYSMNALYDAGGKDQYWELYDKLPPQIIRDLDYSTVYWAQFESPVAEVTEVVNNTYLKVNAQKDGTKSYGRVVDLLLAEYRANNGID